MAIITGLDANDTIRGTADRDLIFGSGGDDRVSGYDDSQGFALAPHINDLADTIVGGPGDDYLLGGGGADYLIGGGQNDVIEGGTGADILVGDVVNPAEFGGYTSGQAAGQDVFVFGRVFGRLYGVNAPADTGLGTERDTVLDFRQGEDKLDFTGWENIGAYGTVFLGRAAFRPGPHLEISYRHEGPDTIVSFLAPPAAATGEVALRGRFDLTPADFVFTSLQPAPARPFADASEASAYRLYDTVFGRRPDAEGLTYWTDALRGGHSLLTVADLFTGSAEFQSRYGTPDNREFVSLLYRNVLDREGEAEGASFWIYGLDQGLARRAEVVVGFSESREHAAAIAGADWPM